MSMEKLEALGDLTQQVDAENPDPAQRQAEAQQAAEEAQSDVNAKQWGMLMYTVGGFAQMIAPELKPVYSEERCYQWGQQANAVAEKYGLNGPSVMPEIALIASTAGFAVPTYLLIRAKLETAKEAKEGTLLQKMGLWWRMRKARRQAQAEQADGNMVDEVPHGSQQ